MIKTFKCISNSFQASLILSLSTFELCTLLLAAKYTDDHNTDVFHCNAIMAVLNRVSFLSNVSKNLMIKFLYNLLQVGLILIHSSSNKTENVVNEWTLLSMNCDRTHIKEALNKHQYHLPLNVKEILML